MISYFYSKESFLEGDYHKAASFNVKQVGRGEKRQPAYIYIKVNSTARGSTHEPEKIFKVKTRILVGYTLKSFVDLNVCTQEKVKVESLKKHV